MPENEPIEIKIPESQIINDIYTTGRVVYPLKLGNMTITLNTMNLYDVELFNVMLTESVKTLEDRASNNTFEMLYTRWLLPFILTDIVKNININVGEQRDRLVNAYKQAQVLVGDEYIKKLEEIRTELVKLQTNILDNLNVYVIDKILKTYSTLNEYVKNIMESDLKN